MIKAYTLNLDANNYVLSVANTANNSIEIDLQKIDLRYLNAYQYINGSLVLDDVKKQEIIEAEKAHEEREENPTTEQRIDALETTTDDIILMMAELIGG